MLKVLFFVLFLFITIPVVSYAQLSRDNNDTPELLTLSGGNLKISTVKNLYTKYSGADNQFWRSLSGIDRKLISGEDDSFFGDNNSGHLASSVIVAREWQPDMVDFAARQDKHFSVFDNHRLNLDRWQGADDKLFFAKNFDICLRSTFNIKTNGPRYDDWFINDRLNQQDTVPQPQTNPVPLAPTAWFFLIGLIGVLSFSRKTIIW